MTDMTIDWLEVSFAVVVLASVLAHTGCTDLKQAIRLSDNGTNYYNRTILNSNTKTKE